MSFHSVGRVTARPPRMKYKGALYHITAHVNERKMKGNEEEGSVLSREICPIIRPDSTSF